MSMLDSVIDQLFGGPEGSPGSPAEKAADVIGSAGQNNGGIGGTIGQTAGAVVGSLFGPAGSTVGGAIGGQVGGLAEKAFSQGVPAGPGTTIDSGGAAQVSSGPVGDAALSVGQSLQRMALRGLQNRPSADGRGKAF